MSHLEDELINLGHTLNDVKTVLEAGNKLEEQAIKVRKQLEPRIKMLEQRLDELAKWGGKDGNKIDIQKHDDARNSST